IIHGTTTRFDDPARFSFAHGGKDGHPFPVPLKVYDETIQQLEAALQKAKLGFNDKNQALKNLSKVAIEMEKDFQPNDRFEDLIQKERNESWKCYRLTVIGSATQLKLDVEITDEEYFCFVFDLMLCIFGIMDIRQLLERPLIFEFLTQEESVYLHKT